MVADEMIFCLIKLFSSSITISEACSQVLYFIDHMIVT